MSINPSIQKLAQLMQMHQKQKETPYVLLLGSSLSLTTDVRRAFAGTEDWEAFWKEMQNTSPTSRKALLKEPLNTLALGPGYQAVARLAEAGYFNLILTLNVDDALDNALKALRTLPASEYRIWVHGEVTSREIAAAFDRPTPRIKVVKLRGDINARKLPLTPKAQFEFPSDLEDAVTRWLSRDTIVVGDLPFDDDVQRCLRSGEDELWCILPDEPASNSFIMRAKQVRLFGKIITGADAEFNAFFTALAEEIAKEKKESDERLLSGEQPSPLGDSDYREIEEEITKERKESDERLLSSEQPGPLGDSDYREIEKEITEEIKELDERSLSSEQPTLLDATDYEAISAEIENARTVPVTTPTVSLRPSLILVYVIAALFLGLVSNTLSAMWQVDTPQRLLITIGVLFLALAIVLWAEFRRSDVALTGTSLLVTKVSAVIGALCLIIGIVWSITTMLPAS